MGATALKAVILAAGMGTRLGDLTADMPKAMIEVAGKPLLEHIICRMMAAGVSEFIFVTKHLAEKIEHHFGDGSRLGASISYARQGEGYGTAAALLAARELVSDTPFVMIFADIITSTETYTQAIETYMDLRGAGVMSLAWVDDPCAGAAVVVDTTGTVGEIVEKPPEGGRVSNWIAAGVYVLDPIIFDYLEQLSPSARGEHELADALNAMIAEGMAVYPHCLEGDWLDVGTVEAVEAAEKMLG